MKKIILFVFMILFSVSGLFADSWSMRPDTDFHAHPLFEISQSTMIFARAKVLKVLRPSGERSSGLLKVLITSSHYKEQVMYAKNFPSSSHVFDESPGTQIIVSIDPSDIESGVFVDSPNRIGTLIILTFVLIASLAYIGGRRAMYSLLSVSLLLFMFKSFYIPYIIRGADVIFLTFIILYGIIIFTVVAICGFTLSGFAALAGSIISLHFLYFLCELFFSGANISGFYLEEIQMINYFCSNLSVKPLSYFKDIMIAMVMIGSTGVIMDVSIAITSTLRELVLSSPGIKTADLYKSGLKVSRDIVATMSNTLIYAYLGLSLTYIMAKVLNITSFFQFVNLENIHVDIYKALLGTVAYMAAIAFSLVLAVYLYKRKDLTK